MGHGRRLTRRGPAIKTKMKLSSKDRPTFNWAPNKIGGSSRQTHVTCAWLRDPTRRQGRTLWVLRALVAALAKSLFVHTPLPRVGAAAQFLEERA